MASTLEQALYEHTTEITTVAAIVSTRIYFDQAPEEIVFPYIVVTLGGGPKEAYTQGSRDAGSTRIEWSCFSHDQWQAHTLARYVRDDLYEYRGLLKGVMIEETRMLDLRAVPSMDPGIFGYRAEALFRWTIT